MAKSEQKVEAGGANVPLATETVFDEAAVEADLKASGQKPQALDGGNHATRFMFLRAASNYKPKIEVVTLPAPMEGTQVKVKELTAGERDKYEAALVRGKMGNQRLSIEDIRINLIIACVVDWDDETTPMFSEKDKPELRKLGISIVQAMYEPASKLSAVTKEDEDELQGNS